MAARRSWFLALPGAAGLAVLVALLLHTGAASAKTFYLDPSGDDGASGTSPAHAWRTLERASRQRLSPGDRVLLKGGATFRGTLTLSREDAGRPGRPVTIASYGKGRARVLSGDRSAVLATDVGGIVIRDLTVVGSGPHSNSGSGIDVVNRLPGNRKLRFVRIDRVDASGFGYAGIAVHGAPKDLSQSGYVDVRITNCVAHDNEYFGVIATGAFDPGSDLYANKDVYIGHCEAYANPGDPNFTLDSSGSGIFVEDTEGAVIEHSIAHDNGRLCGCSESGPVGIWMAIVDRGLIQYNESYDNHTGPSGADGDGFDFDGGTTNSVMQYNYSHGNDGIGFLIYTYYRSPHDFRNNVLRYNISQDDVRRGSNAAIMVANDGAGNVGSRIYGNTVFVSPPASGEPAAVMTYGTTDAHFYDNLFVTTGGLPIARVEPGQDGLVFQGNGYWAGGDPFRMLYGEDVLTSLGAWRARTQLEQLGGRPVGVAADPRLRAPGRGGRIGDTAHLAQLDAYRLLPGSPLPGAGVDLHALAGADDGAADFFGAPVPGPSGWGIGAAQSAG